VRASVCFHRKGFRGERASKNHPHLGLRSEELYDLPVLGPPKPPGRAPPARLGQREKVRYVPAYPPALERIHDYLQAAGHGQDADGPLFEAPQKPGGAGEDRLEPLTHGTVYHRVLRKHAKAAGIDGASFGPHALRATAATKAQDWGVVPARRKGLQFSGGLRVNISISHSPRCDARQLSAPLNRPSAVPICRCVNLTLLLAQVASLARPAPNFSPASPIVWEMFHGYSPLPYRLSLCEKLGF
jgi:hypothetical protein